MPRPRDELRDAQAPSEAWLYSGVFFIFGMMGCLLAMLQNNPWGWAAGLAACVFAGVNAVLWATMFNRRAWWMIIIIGALPFIADPVYFGPLSRLGLFDLGAAASPMARRITMAVTAVVFVSIGFTLIINYIVRREHQGARLKAELLVAQRIHASLVPPIERRVGAVEVFGVSHASSEMGGDLIDAVDREGALDLVLADVSGHGVGAGVVMAMVKSAVHMRLAQGEAAPLGTLVTELNRVVTDLTTPEIFVTLAALRVSTDGRSGEAVLAGHLPVLHWIAGERRLEKINNANLPLGIVREDIFTAQRIALAPGDALILYTDGLIESTRAGAEQFGLARLEAEAERLAGSPPRAMAEGLLAAARAFGKTSDDESVLVVRVA